MESTLEVTPFQKECSGSVVIPGSKSITNRALLLAALSKCKIELTFLTVQNLYFLLV